ncbi:MAG: hypothetical protein JOZ38_10680, partial [Candidatus Eremiobacteraeota bacterium]|nr:hypothetical protein [Candidatus Eremiobacteraeota bacterium]
MASEGILVVTVAAVGVLHTMVPDHWAPIVVVARKRGWSPARAARAGALAGIGHVVTTLALGAVVWVAGVALAVRYAQLVSLASGIALIVFGAWIAYTGWRELREAGGSSLFSHAHLHAHADGTRHVHWHEHVEPHSESEAAVHEHEHAIAGRTSLLLILGSSPMVEGIPAFFAASTKGAPVLGVMAFVFALSTIATYALMSALGTRSVERTS